MTRDPPDWHLNLAQDSAFHGGNYNHELKSWDKCCTCVFVQFPNESQRPSENWPKPKIPFLGLLSSKIKRKHFLCRLATHSSDKSLRVYWRIFVKIFVSATEFCRRNKSHKFRLISLSFAEASLCCRGEPQGEPLRRREVWFDHLRHVAVTKFCCRDKYFVGRDDGRYVLIPLELIRNNLDWLCQKGTRGSRHRQSYDIRTPWYK